MIYNATLLRIDPPAPGPLGADVTVRCALVGLSAEQARVNETAGWGASFVLYVPMRHLPSPRPVVGGAVRLRHDGDLADGAWGIRQVVQRHGNTRTLDHALVYVAPAG